MEQIKCSKENPIPSLPLSINDVDGYKTYKIDENTIGVRPKWIKISDRLPDILNDYLVMGEDKQMYVARFFPHKKYPKWQIICECCGTEGDNGYTIDRWMPLPNAETE